MRTSHALLLRLYHDSHYRFAEVTVCYRDRGAPGDQTCVEGRRILHLGSGFMEIASPQGVTSIPYHRIRTILYQNDILWERIPPSSPSEGEKEVR